MRTNADEERSIPQQAGMADHDTNHDTTSLLENRIPGIHFVNRVRVWRAVYANIAPEI
jgi:hypothetical protein